MMTIEEAIDEREPMTAAHVRQAFADHGVTSFWFEDAGHVIVREDDGFELELDLNAFDIYTWLGY